MKLAELNTIYEAVCNEYVKKFVQKHGYEFTGWVGSDFDVAGFIDQYYFNLSDIILDLTTKQPKGQIFEWQDSEVEAHTKDSLAPSINYKSYTMGLRRKDL